MPEHVYTNYKQIGIQKASKPRCYFCGTTNSVKYLIEIHDSALLNTTINAPTCNRCAAIYGNVCLGIPQS